MHHLAEPETHLFLAGMKISAGGLTPVFFGGRVNINPFIPLVTLVSAASRRKAPVG